jgi:quinohemoprotein amine dehydrogenase alpha subunit-like protein
VAISGTGVTVNSATFNSANVLVLNLSVSGSAATGARNVTVTNPDGGNGTLTNGFTVNAGPTVGTLTPTALPQGSTNVILTLTGSNFTLNTGSEVFSGTGITFEWAWRSTTGLIWMSVDVSNTATLGSHDLTVINPDGGSATLVNAVTVTARPTVTSVSPNSKARGGSASNVTVTGTGFAAGAGVNFTGNGITVVSVTRNSATSLTVRLSVSGGATTGLRDVTVTNPDGGSGTLAGGFRIT